MILGENVVGEIVFFNVNNVFIELSTQPKIVAAKLILAKIYSAKKESAIKIGGENLLGEIFDRPNFARPNFTRQKFYSAKVLLGEKNHQKIAQKNRQKS